MIKDANQKRLFVTFIKAFNCFRTKRNQKDLMYTVGILFKLEIKCLNLKKLMLFFSTGIQLLIFIPYNFSWTINLTMDELFGEVLKMRGTTWSSFS